MTEAATVAAADSGAIQE